MEKIKELYFKYKDKILYIFFGGVTTVVSLGTVYLLERYFNLIGFKAKFIADVIAITVAYITNKIWVFESKCNSFKELLREILAFFTARAFTLVISLLIVFVFVDTLHFNNMLINILTNIFTIIANYVLSKLVVFKKGK